MVPQTKPFTLETKECIPNLYEPGNKWLNLTSDDSRTTMDTFSMMETVVATSSSSSSSEESNIDSPDDAQGAADGEASATESRNEEEGTQDQEEQTSDTDAETVASRQVTLYRAGLLNKKGRPQGSKSTTERKTSVGDRRIGSATQTRRGVRRTTQIVDAVRHKAQGLAGSKPRSPPSQSKDERDDNSNNEGTKALLSKSRIRSTVDEMLLRKKRNAVKPSQSDRFSAAISSWGRSIGILGDEGGPPKSQVLSESPSLVVRVATPMDDVDIANLRLSVFADFSPEMRSQFCFRSCQALAHRRTNGAICVVATPPPDKVRPVILGSAECSYHEFKNTRLGRRRPRSSLLYITEVAVHPSARRKGIGAKLLEAMDEIARRNEIETLFLHVDVSNHAAIALYEKCGYQRTDAHESIYQEFTTSLNLHPGATRGRTHYLLYRNIQVPTWVDETCHEKETKVVGSLGFEIPA